MTKTTISTAELAALIMSEIRKHPECSHVASVGFTKPQKIVPHQANWEPAWTCNGSKIAPLIAFEIGRTFQNQYDLI